MISMVLQEILSPTQTEVKSMLNWGDFQLVDFDGFEYGPLNTVSLAQAFLKRDYASAYAIMVSSYLGKLGKQVDFNIKRSD